MLLLIRGDFVDLSRMKARKIAMIILYQILLYDKNKIEYDIDKVISDNILDNNEYIENMIKGIVNDLDNLKELANKYLDTWPLNRLGLTDQAIILIGIYELINTDTPDIVCINEAVELSKKYSDESVTRMINAMLDNIYHKELKR